MDLLLIGGLSGSGKSVALAALEDSGYYAVSNLPLAQLGGLLAHLKAARIDRVAGALRGEKEPRRRPPFSGDDRTLTEVIEFERGLFADVRARGYNFDTSEQSAAALRAWI